MILQDFNTSSQTTLHQVGSGVDDGIARRLPVSFSPCLMREKGTTNNQ